MTAERRYETKPLECWQKAKELRVNYYRDYALAHEKGGLRWAGGAWSFDAIPAGLGDDVYPLTSEPYGASIGHDPKFSLQCQEACEARGFARDLCAYMRCYIGSILLDKYAWGGPFPRPDFIWQDHICCTHAKWYQVVSDLEGGIPMFCIDLGVGPHSELKPHRLDYVVGQMHDGVEWLEKVTGRKYDDEKLIEAVKNDMRSTSLWAEISALNKNIPAPLDEKSMYSLYVLGTLRKSSKEIADFYEELRDETRERVANQIAAVGNERCRLMTDSQPPWAVLRLYRYLEKYGVVCIGSLYTFALIGIWEEQEDGSWGPAKTYMERGIEMKTRDDALRALAEWTLRKAMWTPFYGSDLKSELMLRIVREWKVDGAMLHLNRGCEGTTIGQMENRLALLKAGIPVMVYEGNMADERELDEVGTLKRMDAFMESLELKKIED